jgi:DNA (cytosine-5)-methyltransferase 1
VRAIEFFSGIGAFAQAASRHHLDVVAAFDQNEAANAVYEHNFAMPPSKINLDSIKIEQIPVASIWWMSPPCTPYTVRGNRRDLLDPRAKSFLNLLTAAQKLTPEIIIIENVTGFRDSQAKAMAARTLKGSGFSMLELDLCPTQFGIPMRRPRHFVVFSQRALPEIPAVTHPNHRLSEFLQEPDAALFLDEQIEKRYGPGFDVVNADDPTAEAICFTKNYARCMKASGSMLKHAHRLRRFSPAEILRLLGFSDDFSFPASINLEQQWKLVGNSVDVRAIDLILQHALTTF